MLPAQNHSDFLNFLQAQKFNPIPLAHHNSRHKVTAENDNIIDENAPLVVVETKQNLIVRPYYSILGIKGAGQELLLRNPVALRLYMAASLLPQGFKLALLDGWRSGDTQRGIYEHFCNIARDLGGDPGKYAFDLDGASSERDFPTDDAPHRTGGAVDVVLIGPDGQDWPMGTDFDAISSRSATRALEVELPNETSTDLAPLLGRRVLYNAMISAGFTNYPEEWWHFDYGNAFWRFYGNFHNGPVFRTITSPYS